MVVVCECVVGVFKIFGPPPDPPPPNRPSPGPPKISLFFFPLSRRTLHSFFSLWEVFSLNFGGVFEDRGAQMCTFGLSGCRVELRRPHQTTKIPREDPQWREKGKKTRNFGPPPLRAHPSGPPPKTKLAKCGIGQIRLANAVTAGRSRREYFIFRTE